MRAQRQMVRFISGVVVALGLGGVVVQQAEQRPRGENVIAHGRENAVGIARHGGRFGVLLVEVDDAAVLGGFDDAELGGVFTIDRNGRHGDFRGLLHVEFDHAHDVHAVDVVAAEDGHHVRVGLFHQVDVLVDGVGRALIPGLVGRAHLGRHGNNELVLQQTAELPAFAEVLQQRLAAELGEHVDGVNS